MPRRYRTFPTDADPWMKARICPAALAQRTNQGFIRNQQLRAEIGDEAYHAKAHSDAQKRCEWFDNLPPHWREYIREYGMSKGRRMIDQYGLWNESAARNSLPTFDIDI